MFLAAFSSRSSTKPQLVLFASVRLSRADIHIDWRGGYAPSLDNVIDDLRRFIRPGKTKWGFYGSGNQPSGYTFGKGDVQARLYNKSVAATDAYCALPVVLTEERYAPALDVWRREIQLKRVVAKGFRLYAVPDADDEVAELEAELSAEELEPIGTLSRFFARILLPRRAAHDPRTVVQRPFEGALRSLAIQHGDLRPHSIAPHDMHPVFVQVDAMRGAEL